VRQLIAFVVLVVLGFCAPAIAAPEGAWVEHSEPVAFVNFHWGPSASLQLAVNHALTALAD
jgi:hypothetical protein